MIVFTDYLGEIEYNESAIITFEGGLYGFEECKKFIIVDPKEEEFPFMWLQSLDDEDLSFIITQPFLFSPNYQFELSDSTVSELDVKTDNDVIVYSIAVIKENVEDSTINLKSPIVINVENNRGKQVIVEENYPFKFELFK